MKIIKFLKVLYDHSFMYNGKWYTLINIPVMAKESQLTEITVRDCVSKMKNEYLLLQMNYSDYNYASGTPDIWTLYEVRLPLDIDVLTEKEMLHSANISSIKSEVDFRTEYMKDTL